MKIVIIGAGSIFFTRRMVLGMAQSAILRKARVAMVDIDGRKCEQMGKFCRKINESAGGQLDITWTTDRLAALPGADYVILAFAIRNYHYRETGTNLSKLHNIHVKSGETAGPSAVFRIIRAVPEVLRVAADIERICPKALVINYVNPTNVIGTALIRHTKVRSYAFCDGMYEATSLEITKYLGVPRLDWQEFVKQYQFKMGGINHFTWLWGLEKDGRSLWDQFKAGLSKYAEQEAIQSDACGEWELTRIYDAWPTQFYHTCEYVRYFQGKGGRPQRDHFCTKWSLNERIRWYRNVWKSIEDCNAGRITVEQALADPSTDMIAAVIESIEGDQKSVFAVNVRNDGRIPNLPADVLVEVPARFGRTNVDAPAVGPMPPGIAGLIHPSIEEQELALEAAMTGNFRTAVKAIAADPLVMSLNDAEDIAKELIAQEEDDMDRAWDAYWWNSRI
ncbi:MAG: hypothetical protein HZA50_03205 [Planctomycetes bacterium]|nr:hypothetical protein [Planctomycetota bacterium]